MSTDAIDERIGELVGQHRPELEQLVRQAVDRELARLVELELRARNGAQAANVVEPAPVRLCRTCGQRPTDRHWTQCGRCRREQCERRQGDPATEEEHIPSRKGSASTSSAGA